MVYILQMKYMIKCILTSSQGLFILDSAVGTELNLSKLLMNRQ